jgi:hypothetical protein
LQCNLPVRVVGPSPILHLKPPLLFFMAVWKVYWNIAPGVPLGGCPRPSFFA